MARLIYASGPGDLFVAIDPGTTAYELPAAATYPVWTAATGGSQHTDLLTVAGAPITGAVVDPANGRARFQGVDGYKGEYWLDVGGGTRYRVHPDGMAERITALEGGSGGGTLPDGDYGAITVSASGTAMAIDANAVGTTQIADNAVTNAKLADNAVSTAELADNAVTAAEIAANAVTTTKIIDNAVTNAKLADDAVNTAEIAANAVNTAEIADNAVTLAKMADVATARILGRTTAATGDPEALTGAQVAAMLPAASSTVVGPVELSTDAEAITGTDTVRATTPANIAAVLAAVAPGSLPAYVPFFVKKAAGVWPARPTSDANRLVLWVGADPPPTIITSGTGGMYESDIQIVKP